MDLPGLITVDPHAEDLIVQLSNMAGDAFLEELWTRELLSALPQGSKGADRERFLSRAMIMNDIAVSAPYQGVYCLEDASALALAYRKSELSGLSIDKLEQKANEDLVKSVLSEEEAQAFTKQLEVMAPISVFDWSEQEAQGDDFIRFVLFAVDPEKRGTGRFRKLIAPFLALADAEGLNCYLETYSAPLESLYNHFGFETIKWFESPHSSLVQRGMIRRPLSA